MQTKKPKQTTNVHEPVLLEPTLHILSPQVGETYLDLTSGYGGHAGAILGLTGNYAGSVLVDRDENAIAHTSSLFAGKGITFLHKNFYQASELLVREGRSFDIILADLGVSSPHLDSASRGFAIQLDGPLDMRMDPRQSITAATIVNTYSEDQLSLILRAYGEEPKARLIARHLVSHRPFSTTSQLAAAVASAYRSHTKRHPATKTFQALRIAVNDELGLLERSLPLWLRLLRPGGRLGVISFHSLEDRIVKQFFSEQAGDRYDSEFRSLTHKPVEASESELVFNPRARSAKLRAVEKIKIKEGNR